MYLIVYLIYAVYILSVELIAQILLLDMAVAKQYWVVIYIMLYCVYYSILSSSIIMLIS